MGTARPSQSVSVTDSDIDTMAALPVFDSVPRAELEWVGARGHVQHFPAATLVAESGSPVDEMWIMLSGRVASYAPNAGSLRKFQEAGPGFVGGAMPFSRMRAVPLKIVAEDDTTVLALSRSHFPDLVRECPELTSALVHHMVDRSRDFRAAQIHDERMRSLGRLASGLAHELNNPASGAASHARSLAPLLDDLHAASKALARARLTDEQLDAVDAVRRMCNDVCAPRSPLDLADREDEFSDWLRAHDTEPTAASALAGTNATVAALDRLAKMLPPETLRVAIGWAASDAAARQATTHITAATERIHGLVAAVKGFTFMDREGVPDHVDIARGLRDTVAMLESKSRSKSVRVRIETADDLPTVFGFGSELNQVWEKLIDNAIDAAPVGGNVTLTATRRSDFVVVRVMDDGPGISEEHRARIFDPFFTTKGIGFGTGLGLDIARRFVHRNNGDLEFTSQPGHTVFRVSLPVAGTKALVLGS